MSHAGFDDTEKQDAVVRDLANVDVIGEAVRSIPIEIRRSHKHAESGITSPGLLPRGACRATC